MNGLLNAAKAEPKARAPDKKQTSGNGSDPEQQSYTALVANGMSMIYQDKVMPQILQMIGQEGGNPVDGLVNAVSLVMVRLEDSAAQSGQQFSPKVKTAAAKELIELIAELAGPKGANLHEFSKEEQMMALELASNAYDSTRSQRPLQPQGGQQQRPAMSPGGLMPQQAASQAGGVPY